jgi:transposase
VNASRVSPVVEALQAWRGGQCTVAGPLVADRGDLTRVDIPRALVPGVGLIRAAYASGEPRRQGSMTTAGHTQARRVLGEGAWASRDPATVSRPVPRRLDTHPKILQDSRWQAHLRRCTRDRRLGSRGQHTKVVTVAMARERAGFLWAMAREVPIPA